MFSYFAFFLLLNRFVLEAISVSESVNIWVNKVAYLRLRKWMKETSNWSVMEEQNCTC